MGLVVRAFPLLPGKREALQVFVTELSERRRETDEFYKAFGVTRESVYIQKMPQGDRVIVCTDLGDVVSPARAFAAEQAPFNAWFKAKVLELTGFDLNVQPLGPDSTQLFDWRNKA